MSELVSSKKQAITADAIMGRETVGGPARLSSVLEEDDLLQVKTHLRKYFTSKRDFFNLPRAFSIWKSKFDLCVMLL